MNGNDSESGHFQAPLKITDNNKLLMNQTDGFGQKPRIFRKSLGAIPFRKIAIDKARTTLLIPRRNSLMKTIRR